MTNLKPTKGKLLISEPSIFSDRVFNRSVVLLTSHDIGGSVGFIFNKPLDLSINDVFPQIRSKLPIYYGGPVSKNNLYFIHKVPELIEDGIEISRGIFWGGNFNKVKTLLKNKKLKNNDIRFFLGYSGWSGKQLEDELETDSWIVMDNNNTNIFSKEHQSLWKDEVKRIGGDYLIWANAPENPSLN